jgi:hypothetical protein
MNETLDERIEVGCWKIIAVVRGRIEDGVEQI